MHTIKEIGDANALYKSFLKCRRDVQWKESVQRFELNLLRNVTQIQKEIDNGKYTLAPYLEFDINERGKRRHVRANSIRDRVVLGALNDEVILPEISKYLIYDNGASQKGKGVSFAENRLKHHLRKHYRLYGCEGYILKIDFEKYFDNINHNSIRKMLYSYIACDKALKEFIDSVIDSFCLWVDKQTKEKDIIDSLHIRKGKYKLCKSVAIGNPIAQSIGIMSATPVDTYSKYVRECGCYGRYMDDIYVIHRSKAFLKELLEDIKGVSEQWELHIHPRKTQIIKLSKGFTFLKKKYSLSKSGKVSIRLYKSAVQREKKRLKKFKKFMQQDRIRDNYKSWREDLLSRYNCYQKIKHTDNFYGREIECTKTEQRKER